MQTFLPSPSYQLTAKILDTVRLNKQLVECQQILNVLHGKTSTWSNHPAVTMWKGYENSLSVYGLAMAEEWRKRKGSGHKSIDAITDYYDGYGKCPWWLGTEELHLSHQSRLVHKGLVDVLKTRFGTTAKEQKEKYEKFASDHGFPKKWNQIKPGHLHLIWLIMYRRRYPEATIGNHYGCFSIDSWRAYIWPTEDRKFKTNASGKWREFFLGEELPILS